MQMTVELWNKIILLIGENVIACEGNIGSEKAGFTQFLLNLLY